MKYERFYVDDDGDDDDVDDGDDNDVDVFDGEFITLWVELIHQLICAGGFASAEKLHFQNYDEDHADLVVVDNDDFDFLFHYITFYSITLHWEVDKTHYLHKEELLAVDPNSMCFLPEQSL